LIISIAAGIRTDALQQELGGGGLGIVRSMPNTPASVGAGFTALFANPFVTSEQRKIAESFFNACGKTHWVTKEAGIDKSTVVTGCGPAFVYEMMQEMIRSAENLGIEPATAELMVMQTVYGAVKLARNTGTPIKTLQHHITTPGGATERGLEEFRKWQFGGTMDLVFQATEARCKQLGANTSGNSIAVTDFLKPPQVFSQAQSSPQSNVTSNLDNRPKP